jgi:hypothetical protein
VFRWGSRRLFNIEKLEKESPVFCPEMLELKRKMKMLQKTFRPGYFFSNSSEQNLFAISVLEFPKSGQSGPALKWITIAKLDHCFQF